MSAPFDGYGAPPPDEDPGAWFDPEGGGVQDGEPESPPSRRLKATKASQVTMRRVRWLWHLRVILGGLTLLAGREGIGKSTIAVWLCAQVTRGLLDGELEGRPRTVVYVNSEDARDYTIVPRLKAAGADLDRVIFVDAVMPGEEAGEEHTGSIVLPADAALLAELVKKYDAAAVILDAATSAIDSKLDGDKDRQMRIGLEAIARKVGEKTGAAVLGIVHFGKRDSNDTGKLILGSIAWSQVARSTLAVAVNEENGELVLTQSKGNLGPTPPSLAFHVINATVPTPEGDTSVGRAVLNGETNLDARDLLGAASLDQEDRTERDTAAVWLRGYLTKYDKAPSKDVKKAALAAGFTERTLARARGVLGVIVSSEGFPRETYWTLPDSSGASDDSDATSHATPHGTTEDTQPDLHEHAGNGSPDPSRASSHMHDTTASEANGVRACGTTGTTGADQQVSSHANGTTGGTTGGCAADDCDLDDCADCFVAGRIDATGERVR